MLSNVNSQLRNALEARLVEKTHGPALAALDDEAEAWNTANAATVEALLNGVKALPYDAFVKLRGAVADLGVERLHEFNPKVTAV